MTTKCKFILGTAQIGMPYGIQSEQKCSAYSFDLGKEVLNRAIELGISTFDSSNLYGRAQEALSHLASGEKLEILSKFALSDERPTVQLNLYETLRQLGIARLSGYSFHRFGDFQGNELAQNDLAALKQKGIIKSIGISVYGNDQLAAAITSPLIDFIQLPFNPLDNWSRRGDLIRLALKEGKVLHARSVFLQGLLLMKASEVPKKFVRLLPLISQIHCWAAELNIGVETFCIGYALSKNAFDGLVIGVDSTRQLESNFKSFKESMELNFDWDKVDTLPHVPFELINPSMWKQLC